MKTKQLTFSAMCIALIAICSWISIPFTIPFTLQTFGIFFTVRLLGGKYGSFSILAYILLGAVGLPVFSGFNSGVGALLGVTGGYIIGFFIAGLVMWALDGFWRNHATGYFVSSLIALFACYAFGTVWFMFMYSRSTGAIGMMSVLGMCVFPFILPDIAKILLAAVIAKQVSKVLSLQQVFSR